MALTVAPTPMNASVWLPIIERDIAGPTESVPPAVNTPDTPRVAVSLPAAIRTD